MAMVPHGLAGHDADHKPRLSGQFRSHGSDPPHAGGAAAVGRRLLWRADFAGFRAQQCQPSLDGRVARQRVALVAGGLGGVAAMDGRGRGMSFTADAGPTPTNVGGAWQVRTRPPPRP